MTEALSPRRTGGVSSFRRVFRSPSIIIGTVLIVLLLLVALFAPLIAPGGFDQQDLMQRLKPPSAEHILGTDHLGRSVLDRLVFGARYSLAVGLLSVLVGLIFGILIGGISGFYGGWIDRLLMGLVDIMLAFPGVLLAIALVAALGPSLFNITLSIGLRTMPSFARLVRGQVIQVREREYVEAARALGASDARLMLRHLLPNITAPIIVLASLDIASAILSVAALSFLGLGAQPPTPDWGGMITEARQYLRTAWWAGLFPGLAILLTTLGFNLLGDGLRDLFDPRSKR